LKNSGTGVGEAISYGAVTVVNAIPMGRGAAVGIDLWTKARVELIDSLGSFECVIKPDVSESVSLAENAVARTLRYFKLEGKYGATVTTESNIPIARGLKSSSAAANAIVLATTAALEKKIPKLRMVNLGVDAALDAGVSLTGAFDDACASFFGGLVATDNLKRRVVKRTSVTGKVAVLLQIPPRKSYTKDVDRSRMRAIAPLSESAFREVLRGNVWTALTMNGLACSAAFGQDPTIVIEVLKAGALAAGISGTGPAISILAKEENVESVRRVLETAEGEIIESAINHKEARAIV
jgi:shikimate kinase